MKFVFQKIQSNSISHEDHLVQMTKPILTRTQSEKKSRVVHRQKMEMPSVTPKSKGSSRIAAETFSDAASQAQNGMKSNRSAVSKSSLRSGRQSTKSKASYKSALKKGVQQKNQLAE